MQLASGIPRNGNPSFIDAHRVWSNKMDELRIGTTVRQVADQLSFDKLMELAGGPRHMPNLHPSIRAFAIIALANRSLSTKQREAIRQLWPSIRDCTINSLQTIISSIKEQQLLKELLNESI